MPELRQGSHEVGLDARVELPAPSPCSDLRFGAAAGRTRGCDLFPLPEAISVSRERTPREGLFVRA
jgi:hypothetical protein